MQTTVTRFPALASLCSQRNLRSASRTLKKSRAIAPDTIFYLPRSVLLSIGNEIRRSDSGVTKAIAINPKSATAHNYLGIAASRKGDSKSREEILQLSPTT